MGSSSEFLLIDYYGPVSSFKWKQQGDAQEYQWGRPGIPTRKHQFALCFSRENECCMESNFFMIYPLTYLPHAFLKVEKHAQPRWRNPKYSREDLYVGRSFGQGQLPRMPTQKIWVWAQQWHKWTAETVSPCALHCTASLVGVTVIDLQGMKCSRGARYIISEEKWTSDSNRHGW